MIGLAVIASENNDIIPNSTRRVCHTRLKRLSKFLVVEGGLNFGDWLYLTPAIQHQVKEPDIV